MILKGGYWEYTEKGKFWRGPGFFAFRYPTHFHRIELKDEEEGSWSFFVRGPKIRDWGFKVNGKFIPQDVYLKEKIEKVPLEKQIQ